jgi:undecaprenyl-diphosphatase
MDLRAARGLNDWAAAHRVVEAVAEFLAQGGVFLLLLIVAAAFLGTGRRRSIAGRRGAAAAGLAAVVSLALAQLVSVLVDRPRPFAAHPDIHLLIHHARDAGFPSDHATGAFAIAVALLLAHRRAGVAALILAVLISASRVMVGAHYPTDVLAGAALGTAVALALRLPPPRALTDALGLHAGELYDRLVSASPLGQFVRFGALRAHAASTPCASQATPPPTPSFPTRTRTA